MSVRRRTKIIATIGPASESEEELTAMIKAGMNLARLNFSHGTANEHIQRAKRIRAVARKLNCDVGILADLQGPKIRIACFKGDSVELKADASFVLDPSIAENAGDENQVGIAYKDLPNDVKKGDRLLLDDGRLELLVDKIENTRIYTKVIVGGELLNHKGINLAGGGLTAPALTDKDKTDLKTAVAMNADYIAISFPRNAADMYEARKLIHEAGASTAVIAKIERAEAIPVIDEIIEASDAVMVARGDLGVEIGEAELPAVQKLIIHRARSLNKAVITATQMMESMITNVIPTRAEVLDVANAVLDGTDAVMLSAETATGEHPHVVIEAMHRICLGAEKQPKSQISGHRMECQFNRTDEAIAMATMYTANHMKVKAIIALTESGATPLWMSRIRSGIPIFAFTPHAKTRHLTMLYRGVFPVAFETSKQNRNTINRAVIKRLFDMGDIKKGDRIILTKGDLIGVHGGTNAMKIIEVDDHSD